MRTLLVSILLWQVLLQLSTPLLVAPSTSAPKTRSGQVKTMEDYFPPPH